MALGIQLLVLTFLLAFPLLCFHCKVGLIKSFQHLGLFLLKFILSLFCGRMGIGGILLAHLLLKYSTSFIYNVLVPVCTQKLADNCRVKYLAQNQGRLTLVWTLNIRSFKSTECLS